MVLSGGKSERTYLSRFGRGLYYGSYQNPRTLVWGIGTVIFILMIATAFLGYNHSPKWPNNNNNTLHNRKLPLVFKRTMSTYRPTNPNVVRDFIKENNLNPSFTYEKLDLEGTKKSISSDLKELSGIYLILNKITLDYYIGSASTGRFYSRFYKHLISLTGSKILKHAINKYGLPNFAFIVIELFPEKVNKENNKELLDLEDFYLKSMLPNYNILTEAGNSFGYKHTDITRIRLKEGYSVERREQIGALNRGKALSADTKALIRKALSAKTERSENSLANLKKAAKPVKVYNLDYTVYGEFSSITEAAKHLQCGDKTIQRALKTDKGLLKRRWIVKYC